MRRAARTVTMVLAATVAAATVLGTTPALAKGEHQGPPHPWRCPAGGDPYCPPGHLIITGPGLDGPLAIGGRDFWTVLYLTGAGYRPWGYAEPSPPPASSLGPRYRATYVMDPNHGPALTMTQDLYPYARGLVWAFTPGGQGFRSDMGRFITPGGWWHSAALLGLLTAHGLPASSPALAASSAAGSLADSGSSVGGPGGGAGGSGQPLTPVWIGVALLAALLGAAAVGARRRDGVEVRR